MTQKRRNGLPPQETAADKNTSCATQSSPESRCQLCRRELRAPQSLARMHGPVCWHRRHDASMRLAPLDCGCSDSWTCRCTRPPLTERDLDGYANAARHLLEAAGCTPMVPMDALRGLYRRGGDDRVLAEQLHAMGGAVA